MRSTIYHRSKHLEASEVYSAAERCPVCLSDAPRKPVFLLQESPTIRLLECPSCRGVSADQMPLPAVLDAYYTHYWHDSGEKLTYPSGDHFASRILAYVSLGKTGGPIRILDFGGGEGALARKIAQRLLDAKPADIEIDVVDWGAADRQEGEHIRIRGHRTLDAISGPYDLVLASSVLEHVPDANKIMRNLFDLVGPGGFFYARTPYVLPLARLHRKLDFTYPGHVHDMGSGFWGRITQTFGLRARIVRSGPSPVETLLKTHPARTLLAWTLKAPASLEAWLLSADRKDRLWRLVGGWEIVLQFAD